jgi:hypothetical protein
MRVDDTQHLGGRRLLLQRLARLGDQPRVLDRDDRLRREVLQQCDLLVAKRPHVLAVNADEAANGVVMQQGHHHCGADAAEINQRPAVRFAILVRRLRLHIRDMENARARKKPSWQGLRPEIGRVVATILDESGRHSPRRRRAEPPVGVHGELAERRVAYSHSLFEHRIEDRREVAGRGIDDPKHLGGRNLLLQRLARLGDQPRVLHRDHRLRRKVLQ